MEAQLTFLAHVLGLLLSQSLAPFDRADALLKSSSGLECKVRVSILNSGEASGTFQFRKPNLQRFVLKGQGLDQIFLQNGESSLLLDQDDKEYGWYPSNSAFLQVPPESSRYLHFGQPEILTRGSLSAVAPRNAWQGIDRERVRGQETDVIAMVQKGVKADESPFKLWIDQTGKIVRYRTVVVDNGQMIVTVVDLIDSKYSAPDAKTFENSVPDGYAPMFPPKYAVGFVTGDAFPSGQCVDMQTEKPTDVAVNNKRKATVVLFTSDDLDLESRLGWSLLKSDLAKANIDFVQIWLGRRPESFDRSVATYWDKDGSFEKKVGITSTPFLVGVKDGIAVTGWKGMAADQGREASETLIKGLTQN